MKAVTLSEEIDTVLYPADWPKIPDPLKEGK